MRRPDAGTLKGRLERWRKANPDDYMSVDNPVRTSELVMVLRQMYRDFGFLPEAGQVVKRPAKPKD